MPLSAAWVEKEDAKGGGPIVVVVLMIVEMERWGNPGGDLKYSRPVVVFHGVRGALPATASRVIDVPRSAWESVPARPPGGKRVMVFQTRETRGAGLQPWVSFALRDVSAVNSVASRLLRRMGG